MKRVLPLFALLFLALTFSVRFGPTLAQAGLEVRLAGTVQGALGAKASWNPKDDITRIAKGMADSFAAKNLKTQRPLAGAYAPMIKGP